MVTHQAPAKTIKKLALPMLMLAGFTSAPAMSNALYPQESTLLSPKPDIRTPSHSYIQLKPATLLAYSQLHPSRYTYDSNVDTSAPFFLQSQGQFAHNTPSENASLVAKEIRLTQQRGLYGEAIKTIYAGKKKHLKKIKKELKDYPLTPYLEYHEIRRTISLATTAEIDAYILTHPDLPVARFLKTRKLFSLAKAKKWAAFLAYYSPNTDTRLNCYHQQALLNTQNKISNPDEIKRLWLVGKSQPKSCDKVFHAWLDSEHFDDSYAWDRYILALKNNRPSLAKYLIKHLPESDKKIALQGITLFKKPEKIERLKSSNNKKKKDILHIALSRLIYKNPEKAGDLIPSLIKKHQLNDAEMASQQEKLATILAVRFHPEAERWLEIANKEKSDPLLNELEIRTALRNLEWEKANNKINALAPDTLNSDRWQYWQARTLKQIKNSDSSDIENTYQDLAKKRGFYAYMARDGAPSPSNEKEKPSANNSIQKSTIINQTNVTRAYEFHMLGQHTNARREWHYAMKLLSPEQRLVAAEVAQEWDRPGLSIRAANSATPHKNFDLRFPMGYSDEVSTYAKKNQLDQGLVFALIRQESLFTPDARSHAGALGMMQLMPATAKLVAQQNNISYRGTRDLLNPAKNIHLGTTYLKQLVNKFDNNEVLAMAAYNAGPHRVAKWIPEEEALPLDVWIETIPFKETRNYVKHLLSNQDIYREKLGLNLPRAPFHKMINPS